MNRRAKRLRANYGITIKQYDAILAFQQGVCAICRRPPKRLRLSVDHRHSDGLTRGLLCWRHNRGIGLFGDNPVLLERAIEYLTNPPAVRVIGEVLGRKGRITNKRS